MLILALDTTTRAGSCALARDGEVLREEGSDASKPQAARLPGELMALLDAAGVTLTDIDAFGVATGPGSFTGLRIGIAAMQGLAFAEGKPLIGISALDALFTCGASHWHPTAHGAAGTPPEGSPRRPEGSAPHISAVRVATWVDAWRGDVYAALYENGRAIAEPMVAKPEDLLRALAAREGPPYDGMAGRKGPPYDRGPDKVRAATNTLFIGDGAATYREVIVATLGDAARIAEPPTPLLAGTIAQLATVAYKAGQHPPPHAIRPLYVRRPDAEIARGPKESAPHSVRQT